MKKLIGIFFFALTSAAFAAPSPPDSTFGFAEALYWQVRESGADNWGQLATGAGAERTFQVLDAAFNWNTGVRVGVGRTFNQNSYDLTLIYTHYQTKATNQASGTVISSFDGNYFANNTNGANLDLSYSDANIRWQFFFNTLDFNVGRQYKPHPLIQFHPYLGLKAATINQSIYSNWLYPNVATTFTAATEDLKNNFTGIGPTAGVDTTWALYAAPCQSLNLIGNIAGGILWGHWYFRDVYSNNTPVTINVHNNSINGASPLLDGLLGLEWVNHFATSTLSIRAGYEAQIWFNQMEFYSLNFGKLIRPLSLQGGNVEFRYNF